MKAEQGSVKKRLGKKLRLASLVLFSASLGGCCNWECYSLKPDIHYSQDKGFYDRRCEVMGCLNEEIVRGNKMILSCDEPHRGSAVSILYRFGN